MKLEGGTHCLSNTLRLNTRGNTLERVAGCALYITIYVPYSCNNVSPRNRDLGFRLFCLFTPCCISEYNKSSPGAVSVTITKYVALLEAINLMHIINIFRRRRLQINRFVATDRWHQPGMLVLAHRRIYK